MGHYKEFCKHGIVVRQCRCPGGTKTIVPCPESCKRNRIEKLEHDVPYGNPFCTQCGNKEEEILGLLRQIVSLEERLEKYKDRYPYYPKDFT